MDWLKRFQIYQECVEFLNHEADLLDQHRYAEWEELLTEDIVYQVPIRLTREKEAETEFSSVAFHMNEDRGSIKLRVKRSQTDFNFAEDPKTRTRHFVTNFRLDAYDGQTEEAHVRTNLLLFRQQFDEMEQLLVSAERRDVLRKVNGQWKLAKRVVYFDHTTIPLPNLAIFF